MKVLFVGNSHTYFNDMPALFARFAELTTGERPEVTMLAYSGRDWAWHRKEYYALRFNLMYGGYDYCVLQQAAHPYPPVESTKKFGAELIALCHHCGVTPVVYMTWAEKRFPENQQIMVEVCEALANENRTSGPSRRRVESDPRELPGDRAVLPGRRARQPLRRLPDRRRSVQAADRRCLGDLYRDRL